MSDDIISRKTLIALREFLVGSTLREIRNAFDAAGIECDDEYDPDLGGERRTLVEQYYHSLDLANPSDIRKLMSVYESVLVPALQRVEDRPDLSRSFERSVSALVQLLKRDGFELRDSRLVRRRSADTAMALGHAEAVATTLDTEYVDQQITRMKSAVDDDPEPAIGTAKEFVETICRTILGERGGTYDRDDDVGRLVKLSLNELGITAEGVPSNGAAVKVIRRVLGGLGSVAQGLAELRNLHGTGHGKSAGHESADPHYARLAVGAATALGVFLFEIHQEQQYTSGEDE